MQTHPYVFKRAGEIVAKLEANGQFHTNADGAGWFSYDSILEFFEDMGVEIHPTEYITQLAELLNALPEIDLAALQAVQAQAQAQAQAPAPAVTAPAPAPTPKPKRGRAAKPPAGVEAAAPAVAAQAQVEPTLTPTPTPTPTPIPIPQAGTPAPTANPLMDPAVQKFLASQKAAAANNPPLPLPVPTPPAAGAPTTPFTSDGNPAPVVVTATTGGVESPAAGTRTPNPVTPVAPATPAVQLPTRTVTDAVDALIKTHGIVAVAAAFVQWATNGAEAAESYGLVETAKRLRAIAAAHSMTQGL